MAGVRVPGSAGAGGVGPRCRLGARGFDLKEDRDCWERRRWGEGEYSLEALEARPLEREADTRTWTEANRFALHMPRAIICPAPFPRLRLPPARPSIMASVKGVRSLLLLPRSARPPAARLWRRICAAPAARPPPPRKNRAPTPPAAHAHTHGADACLPCPVLPVGVSFEPPRSARGSWVDLHSPDRNRGVSDQRRET